MNESTKLLLIKVLKKITGRDFTNIDENTDLKNHLNLDSIQIVELFAALEEETGMELPLEIMNCRNIKDFLKIFEETIKYRINS